MTANEAHLLTVDADVLNIYLADVYEKIKEAAERGNYELMFSNAPINLGYTEWNMLKHRPDIASDFINYLAKVDGYIVVNNSDKRSLHKTITIRWN